MYTAYVYSTCIQHMYTAYLALTEQRINRVGQNNVYICSVFGRDITKYTVIFGV